MPSILVSGRPKAATHTGELNVCVAALSVNMAGELFKKLKVTNVK